MQQATETIRASSRFHHSTRALAPGEALPAMPSLLEQVMACAGGMSRKTARECDELDETNEGVDEVFEDEGFDDE